LFRKEDWQKVGGFKPEFVDGMEDYDFWLSIIELGREVVQLPELLFLYRIKENSRTKQFIATQKKLIDSYDRIYCNHPKLFSENIDLFVHVLRKALLDQIEWSKKYRGIIEKLGQIKELFKGKKI
jgi:GT2 family glycosyltransferase